MSESVILPATLDACYKLAPRMRVCDQREVWAAAGQHPLEAIVDSFDRSEHALSLWAEGEPYAIWGVVPVSGICIPWMLGSEQVARHAAMVMRTAVDWLATLRVRYAALINWVHAENEISLTWLGRLGFTIAPPAPWGALGEDFCQIYMEGDHV